MPKDLNYGYRRPEGGDESLEQWMPILEEFMERIVDHEHDGIDSSILDSVAIKKTDYEVIAGRIAITDASYTNGSPTADLGVASVTAGMYGYGDDIALESYVISVDGNVVTMNNNFLGSASGDGEIVFSDYKKIDDSMFEKTVSLAGDNVAKNNHYKFYISSTGEYYLRTIYPTVVDTEINTMTFKISDDRFDVAISLI